MFTDYFPPSRLNPGRAIFVAPLDNDRSGLSWNTARNSLQSAIDIAEPGDVIYVAPGTYTEDVAIPFDLQISIIGVGPLFSSIFVGSDAAGTALTTNGNGTYLQNLHIKGADTASIALRATCEGGVYEWCKFSAAASGAVVGPGSSALVTASFPTESTGVDNRFFNCTFSDATNGILLHGTDYGASARTYLNECVFERCSTQSIGEETSGGTASSTYRDLLVKDCVFLPALDGTEPTKYILLNGSNSNTGLVTGCRFTVSLTSTKNLVSTKCIWTGNFHPAGLSTGQPS